MSSDMAQAALDLLNEVRSSQPVDEGALERALDPGFWRDLNPQLSVSGSGTAEAFESDVLSGAQLEEIARHIRAHGYFHTPPALDLSRLQELALGVERVREAGWPPAFCFIYDDYWLAGRAPLIAGLVRAALGHGYSQIPKMWCHRVDPGRRSSGWSPHRDGYAADARDGRLTVWVPLSEANLENGCIYLVPKDMVPDDEPEPSATTLLRGTRALPARPGEAIGWDCHTLHWGGSCSGYGSTPRVALSFEFIAEGVAPHSEETPLIDPAISLPSFEERLALIAHGVLEYARFEVSLARYAPLARELGHRLV
jgi:ectoine hydroxylase-related dioxygenase (phytanoyl-CoA dioxygenase family)